MIAVSGSGIAGLAAALAVIRNQKPLLLVAGRTPATTLQGGVQIAPNGWAALDQLGLGDLMRLEKFRRLEVKVFSLLLSFDRLAGY